MNWEQIVAILNWISGPVIGAIIGLVTNYLAVKMLFRPYFPKKIGKIRVPFTPGIIPKRKGALARAIGHAVGNELFTSEDIKSLLCSEGVENRLVDYVKSSLSEHACHSFNEISRPFLADEASEGFKDSLSSFLSDKILSAVSKIDVGELVVSKGKEAIMEKKASLGMLGMFLTDSIIDPILDGVKDKVEGFVQDEGEQRLLPIIREEVSIITDSPLNEQFNFAVIDEQRLTSAIISLYEGAVSKAISATTDSLDICGIVEDKINKMDIRELERLCLSVMKKELNAVVILGGIIGFIIGIINCFI